MQKKKCSRKILAVMLSVVLVLSVLPLFTLTASADNPKIVVESKSAERGSDVDISISLENNPGIASLKLSVSFPEGITLKSASYNSEQLGGTATPVANYESPVILNWISPLSNVTGDIIFATLTFTADGAAALGDKSITVSYNQADVYDVFGEDVAFETESGKITVIPCSHPGTVIKSAVAATCTEAGYTGDTHCVKCDEILSYGSVIDALGHNYEAVVTAPTFTAQGYTTYTCSRCGDSYISDYTDPKVLGDVNRDGFIDNKDLTRFYQYLSGQSVTVDETVMDLDESGTITNSDMLMLFIDLTNTHESTVSNITGAESAPRIAVESKSVHPGESFDTRILVKNNPGVSSIKLEITYPEGLVLNDVIFANDIGDFYRTSASVNSPVILNFISPLEEISDDFALATLKFTVSGTVSPGEKDIVVAYKQANIYNSLEQDVAFATENGIITVGACQHTQTEIRDAVAATYSTEGYTGDTYCLICGQKISEGAVIPRETMKITVENVTTEVGKTVSLRIFITNNPGIISMKVKVAFPEGITLNKPIVYNTAQMGGQAVPPQNTNSPATLNWQSPFANVAGDYTFATLSFTVGNSVAPGDYDITLTCDQADIFNLAEDDVLFTIQNGKITVAPCAHENTTVYPAVASTCTVQGHDGYEVCNVCGAIINGSDALLPLDTTNHTGETEVRNAASATCTEAGYTGDTYCLSCNTKIEYGTIIPALGHTGGTATCHSKAVCTRCGEEYGEFDANNHDGATEVRDAVAATCTATGYTGDTYCLGCNQKIANGEVTAALGHNYVPTITAPTCTEGGYTTHTCSRCGGSYVDTYTDAVGHTAGDWEANADNHWHICTACGEKLDEAAHTESDWIIDVEATMYAAGSKHKECTVCGKVLQTEIIPDTHVPGDINGDGVLNNKDLNRLFQYLSDWDVTVLETALDVNGDGTVNNKDLNRLFQYLSDWDVEIY